VQKASALSSALGKLQQFVLTAIDRPDDDAWSAAAIDAWFAGGERVMHEWEQTSFMGYLAHGHADERGERMIDRFLHAPAPACQRTSAPRSSS
jgi:hypothetical protein